MREITEFDLEMQCQGDTNNFKTWPTIANTLCENSATSLVNLGYVNVSHLIDHSLMS